MKLIFVKIITVTLFISCNSSVETKEVDYTGYIDQKIWLKAYNKKYDFKDSLGVVSLKTSQRLDTSYSWEDYSDCRSCGWIKYRFGDKKYPQIAESGWFPIIADSVYQLDIWHKPIKEAPDSKTLKPNSEKDTSSCDYHSHIVWTSEPAASFLFKKFKIINSRPFIISAFTYPTGKGKFSNSFPLFIVAETNLESRELYFVGQCRAKDTTGFIDNMYKSFLSIKIQENP
jgi:hypothetical protein